ncbi:alpha-defensin 1-like [Saccopteryx bilineata]|uniref:alpha-defensin 1-like n=1 Tax=Saccopteryx bilineata TaxID=59482 RepID=UPI00338E02BB
MAISFTEEKVIAQEASGDTCPRATGSDPIRGPVRGAWSPSSHSKARVEPLWETADQVPAQDQPEAEDQDVAISFTEEKCVAREASGLRKITSCQCRPGFLCDFLERVKGNCRMNGHPSKLCCH